MHCTFLLSFGIFGVIIHQLAERVTYIFRAYIAPTIREEQWCVTQLHIGGVTSLWVDQIVPSTPLPPLYLSSPSLFPPLLFPLLSRPLKYSLGACSRCNL